jgi:hypothetical protein
VDEKVDSRQGARVMDETDVLGKKTFKSQLFFASLGECITAWADVESQLFYLFMQALFGEVVNQADWGKATLLFSKFYTFSTRLDYTSMLIEHCLRTSDDSDSDTENDAQKYWKELKIEIKQLAEFRNLLAHQPVAPPDQIVPTVGENGYIVLTLTDEMVIPNELYGKKKFKPIKKTDLEAHLKSVSKRRKKLKHVSVNLQHWKDMADNKRKS